MRTETSTLPIAHIVGVGTETSTLPIAHIVGVGTETSTLPVAHIVGVGTETSTLPIVHFIVGVGAETSTLPIAHIVGWEQRPIRYQLHILLVTLRAPLSGTFLQTLPDLVTPRSCPATQPAPSESFRLLLQSY